MSVGHLVLPHSLTCELFEDWTPLDATFSAQHREQSDGLPGICYQLDPALMDWSMGLLKDGWSDANAMALDFFEAQYFCDTRLEEEIEAELGRFGKQKCEDLRHGRKVCLHGTVATMACAAIMLARHHDALDPSYQNKAISSVGILRFLLHHEQRFMEFLDSSNWHLQIADVANILDVYESVLQNWTSGTCNFSEVLEARLRSPRRPWHPDSYSWQVASWAAKQSLAMIASWRAPLAAPAAHAQALKLWVFGTHCSVMAEPISAVSTLLSEEFQIHVTWQGTSEYCAYHEQHAVYGGKGVAPVADKESKVRSLFLEHWKKAGAGARSMHHAHKDFMPEAWRFADELEGLLRTDLAFRTANLALCSEPAIACVSMHRAGKSVIGYFGVHIAFLVQSYEAQTQLYQVFLDELAQDPRNSFATVAPYLSLQVYRHTSLQLPAVRPLSMYTQPVTYSGGNSTEVLLNRRPVLFWNRQLLFNSLAQLNGINLRFRHVHQLPDKTFGSWLSHRAGVYFPYDWLQTMAFYDWINMALPTFVPDTPMYTFTMLGTNTRSWITSIFEPPKHVYPYEYTEWDDLEGRVFWWHMTDFKALPSVRTFASLSELFTLLLQEPMIKISAEMRLEHLRRTHSTAIFWQQALLRAVVKSALPSKFDALAQGS